MYGASVNNGSSLNKQHAEVGEEYSTSYYGNTMTVNGPCILSDHGLIEHSTSQLLRGLIGDMWVSPPVMELVVKVTSTGTGNENNFSDTTVYFTLVLALLRLNPVTNFSL